MSIDNRFSSRLRQAMTIRGFKQVELCAKAGIPKSALSQYLSGAFEPKQDRLWAIAKALDVSEAWLMGYDVAMEREVSQPEISEISQEINNDPLAGQLFAAYGKVKEEFSQAEIDDITMIMEMIAEKKRRKREKGEE